MSTPMAVLGSIAVGYAVSKLTEKITGSETLGMVAGLAAGGWAGSAIAGYQAATVAATAASSGAAPGSALGIAGGAPLSGGTAVGAAGSPIAAQAATGTAGSVLPGAAPAAAKVAAPAAATTFLGFSPDELLKVAAGGLSGMAEYRQRDKELDVYEDRQKLREEEFEEDKRRYNAQGAYGVTNDGRVVPINAGQQLQDMNQRLGYMPHTSTGTAMTNINTIQRPEGGYVSGFGRFQKENQNA